MFLDLEQADDGATMHFGAVMVFDPLPGRRHAGHRPPARASRPSASTCCRATACSSPTRARAGCRGRRWEPAPRFDIAAHVRHATLPAPGRRRRAARVVRRLPVAPAGPPSSAVGDRAARRPRRRPLGARHQDAPLPRRRHGVGRRRAASCSTPSPRRRAAAPRRTAHRRAATSSDRGTLDPELLARDVKAGAGALLHPATRSPRAAAVADLLVHEELIAAPDCSLNGPLSATRGYRAVPLRARRPEGRSRHALGGTINDVVLAISAGGLRRLLLARGETPPAAGLRAQIPVNVRTSENEHDARQRPDVAVRRAARRRARPARPLRADRRARPNGSRPARSRAAARRSSTSPASRRRSSASCSAARCSAARACSTSRSPTCARRRRRCTRSAPAARGAPLRAAVLRALGRHRGRLLRRRARVRARRRPHGTPDLDMLAEGIEASFAELPTNCRDLRVNRRPEG